ncbi:unnamed protein product [Adineta ricciae]|uniref:Uncharacterized protein n=1 Tax=Adineta ricciae TaxID=249248 RepID=A0A815P7Q7_ADIRI|nr:unnamed protein product [Adineta ricciae]CAF1445379.1 unnamed protein product [Adineta ricciae]
MVLFYGLLALERAQNTVSVTNERASLARKRLASEPSTSMHKRASSLNSWIYTKDLQKHFDERCLLTSVYVLQPIPRRKYNEGNSWIYSTSKNSSPAYCVSKQVWIRDQPSSEGKSFKRSLSSKANTNKPLSPNQIPKNSSMKTKPTRLCSLFSFPPTYLSNHQARLSSPLILHRNVKT